MTAPVNSRGKYGGGECGAALILAMVFVFAIGLVLVAILNFSGTAVVNTNNLRVQRTVEANAESATTLAAQYQRDTFTTAIYTSAVGTACLPSGAYQGFLVYCVGTRYPGAAGTRVVQLYTCPSSFASLSTCNASAHSSVNLYAVVTYDDVPPNASPTSSVCDSSGTTTCGIVMTVDRWDVRFADT
jgi:hypothetical protein